MLTQRHAASVASAFTAQKATTQYTEGGFAISTRKKPSLGQNFLSDTAAIARIAASLGDISHRLVIEIGPGRGAITDLLAARAGRLIAVELDRTLAPLLQSRYSANPAVTVLQQDILELNLGQVVAANPGFGAKALIIGNLPYYITSDILLHLADHADAFETASVMMQREVAERVTAAPGSREYGLLSATMQMTARAELLLTLPPQAFSPPPNVYSSVVRLTMHSRYAELGVERAPFAGFLKQAFAQKRKTLARNLRNAGYESEKIANALSHLDPLVRAEACSLPQMAEIFRTLRR